MLQLFSKLFRRSREIEAKLLPTEGSQVGGKGEIEIESWSDGSISLEASLKDCGLPDGSEVEVYCGDVFITSLVVSRGYAKAEITTPPGDYESPAAVGDEGSFRHGGDTIHRGIFRPD